MKHTFIFTCTDNGGGPSSDERTDVPAAEGTAEQDPGGL